MAGLWQRTGNVTVTNGSRTVTGFGTKWKTGTLPIQKGHAFYGPDGLANEVDTVVSDTEILLVEAYRGGTLANQPYKIDITRTSTISQFSAELSALVGKYRTWFDSMMTWLTGSGDVGILNPDTGATVTIPSWKKVASEGEGQAARAKVEADRAKTEADRSGTEADRAAGIVAAAALPLPDVWAPLSDSLRLITGYGRDVLVGSDVVARMVNFSRNSTATYIGKDGLLKTAAANEPRFEKEGLLIEGQSTNLTQRSEDWDFFNHVTGGATVKTATEQNPYGASSQIKSAVCAIANSNVSLVGAPQDMTGVKSLSVFFNIKVAPSGFFVYVASASDKVTISPAGEISSVASGLTATVKPVGGAGWRRLTISTGIAVSRFSFNLTNVSDEIAFWGVQTEALPFASSYIPTAGAAVTRAADKAWLNVAGNLIPLSVIALEFNSIAPSSFYQAPNLTRYIVHTGDGTGITAYLGRFTTQFEDAGAAQGSTISQGRTVVVGGVSGGKAAIRSGAGLASGVAVKGFKQTEIYLCNSGSGPADRQAFGHVRNLRLYHRDLTADQYKAVA
ncbi:phage head spike fiber domain-containing protein [Aeromonas veronii]|uniref:phage head spike fiber domain-containing protein n=1 Tax=Aeromonas veronii TaxID=654 RepID=UPI003BA216DB